MVLGFFFFSSLFISMTQHSILSTISSKELFCITMQSICSVSRVFKRNYCILTYCLKLINCIRLESVFCSLILSIYLSLKISSCCLVMVSSKVVICWSVEVLNCSKSYSFWRSSCFRSSSCRCKEEISVLFSKGLSGDY